jgi:CRP-like cAMP-binding protein
VQKSIISTFVDKLSRHTVLTPEEQQALLDMPITGGSVRAEEIIVPREATVQHTCIVVRGLIARTTHSQDGQRQITSFYVPGDMPDLFTLMRPRPALSLRAVCNSEILRIPHRSLQAAASHYPSIAEAFWRETTLEGDIASEWVVNVGARSAKERLAHLFCEMAVKMKCVQEANTHFEFPVTQTHLAEATGLSTVHVNRSLQSLRKDGLLRFEQGKVVIPDWQAMVRAGDFDGGYLESERPLRFLDRSFAA